MTEPIETRLRNRAADARRRPMAGTDNRSLAGPCYVLAPPAEIDALAAFVAAARRWDDHLPDCGMWRHEVERVGQLLICSGKDTLDVGEPCTCGYEEFRAALDALDREASRG